MYRSGTTCKGDMTPLVPGETPWFPFHCNPIEVSKLTLKGLHTGPSCSLVFWSASLSLQPVQQTVNSAAGRGKNAYMALPGIVVHPLFSGDICSSSFKQQNGFQSVKIGGTIIDLGMKYLEDPMRRCKKSQIYRTASGAWYFLHDTMDNAQNACSSCMRIGGIKIPCGTYQLLFGNV